MPIYEYVCKQCDHRLDALQKTSDDPLVECPACGDPSLKRLLSAPRFRLKGGGWYETDFKKDNQRNIAKADSDAGSKDGASKDGGSKDGASKDGSKQDAGDKGGAKEAKDKKEKKPAAGSDSASAAS